MRKKRMIEFDPGSEPDIVFEKTMEAGDPGVDGELRDQQVRARRMLWHPETRFVMIAVGPFNEEGERDQDGKENLVGVVGIDRESAGVVVPELARIAKALREHLLDEEQGD